jgi:hypothetical protein
MTQIKQIYTDFITQRAQRKHRVQDKGVINLLFNVYNII